MTTTILKTETAEPTWYVVDAKDQILGRFATKLATVLMGKHKPEYTPHVLSGDAIVVLNAHLVRMTGNDVADPNHPGMSHRMAHKEYATYSGYPGGRTVRTGKDLIEKAPERILQEAVRRMLPKNKLASRMLKNLRLVNGTEHGHQAQDPQPLPEYLYK